MAKEAPIPFSIDAPRFSVIPAKASHAALRAGVRKFMDTHVVPYLDDWEEKGEVPRELHVKAAQDPSGFYTLRIPKEYGGMERIPDVDAMHAIIINEELLRTGSSGIGAALMTWGIGLPPIINHGSEDLKRRIVPGVASGEKIICLGVTEPWGGSDVQNIQTAGKDMGDHWLVNGVKTFITSGCRADYFTVAVKTGKHALTGMTLMVLERGMAGIKTTPMKKMGWWCSDTAIVTLENVKVPKANVIGKPGKGFLYAMGNFNTERLGIASQCIAGARVCLEDAIRYARVRKTFGKALIKNQGIRWKLMEVAREVEACQAMMESLAMAAMEKHDAEEKNDSAYAPDPLLIAKFSLLKVNCTRVFEKAAREAAQIFGGKSYLRSGPGARVERLYREVRVMAIGGGSEEIMLELASRQAKL
eukprot:TRINITY_DN9799_c0_g1_i2.p1 TRINITY_DN9799_c0_g1~~TRINITY_DN9799_c0_g1_i2.p1  ORF type:complete len:417 (+),score=170.74 TRINITY_DN9799_c0_g1_i2:76-1326(+)